MILGGDVPMYYGNSLVFQSIHLLRCGCTAQVIESDPILRTERIGIQEISERTDTGKRSGDDTEAFFLGRDRW